MIDKMKLGGLVMNQPDQKLYRVTHMEEVADPTPLGLFGLAMVTLVASTQKLGWTDGTAFVLPWAILLGSFGQLIASYFDFKKGNAFGSVVFAAYGLFWSAIGMGWAISIGALGPELQAAVDTQQLGVAYLGYFIFTIFGTIAGVRTNKVVFIIMVLIDFLFLGLFLSTLEWAGHWAHMLAAWSEMAIAVFGFYGAGAILVNKVVGRVILPVGKPFGFEK